MRVGDISHFGFYRLSDSVCPDFLGTTGLGCCIPPRFLVTLAKGWKRTLIFWYGYWPWRVVEHVNDWCFRDIYKGGLWDDDLHVCAQLCATIDILFV